MSIGSRIKERREQLGLSRNELALKIGITPSAIANYENEISSPKVELMYKLFDALDCDANYLHQDDIKKLIYEKTTTLEEFEHIIKKYRFISKHSPNGLKMIDTILDGEYAIADELRQQRERLASSEKDTKQEVAPANLIALRPKTDCSSLLMSYFHSASAGTGVFILGNEVADQIAIPNLPKYQKADYAIKVSGISMEPDYNDGDIVLVSQRSELRHGDIGIFIINNEAYIKEYGEYELISKNPDADNIKINKYDNIVCMGKVIGKLEDSYEIIEN